MKSLIYYITVCVFAAWLAGCSTNNGSFKLLDKSEIDQKSYAVAYESTVQTYQDRVNGSYDIESFIRGVNEWYSNEVPLPIEQIRASLLNRMMDHNIYAYYSGVLFAADLQQNFSRLSRECWSMIQPQSMTQGIYDAMKDLQKNNVRNDKYLSQGAEQLLKLCVKSVEDHENQTKNKSVKKS